MSSVHCQPRGIIPRSGSGPLPCFETTDWELIFRVRVQHTIMIVQQDRRFATPSPKITHSEWTKLPLCWFEQTSVSISA